MAGVNASRWSTNRGTHPDDKVDMLARAILASVRRQRRLVESGDMSAAAAAGSATASLIDERLALLSMGTAAP